MRAAILEVVMWRQISRHWRIEQATDGHLVRAQIGRR